MYLPIYGQLFQFVITWVLIIFLFTSSLLYVLVSRVKVPYYHNCMYCYITSTNKYIDISISVFISVSNKPLKFKPLKSACICMYQRYASCVLYIRTISAACRTLNCGGLYMLLWLFQTLLLNNQYLPLAFSYFLKLSTTMTFDVYCIRPSIKQ